MQGMCRKRDGCEEIRNDGMLLASLLHLHEDVEKVPFYTEAIPLMIDLVNDQLINNQLRQEFRRARRRALARAALGMMRRRSSAMIPLDRVRACILITGQRDRGIQCVPLHRIIGSEGRYSEFDRHFLPLKQVTEQRWTRVGRAYYADVQLPPIELYQIGSVYFVSYGNNRVSVSRQR